MNFTKVHNPTDKEVALQFLGEHYTIGAGKTQEFPEDVAKHWVSIYAFMSFVTEEPVAAKEPEAKEVNKTKVAKKK